MRIFSWNVNGIRAVIKKGFFQWIDKENPDIVCLQETKIHSDQITPEIQHKQGYHSYFFSAQRKGYSGVAVYSKLPPQEVHYGFGLPIFDEEGRVLHLQFPDFHLVNVYFPNGKRDDTRLQYKYDFYSSLLDYLRPFLQKKEKMIVCGDYNTAHQEIDLARPKENKNISGFLPEERKWLDRYLAEGFIDTFRSLHPNKVQYSWWSHFARARERNIGWRIDYHFASLALQKKLKKAEIHDSVQGSDHCPIMLEI
ncbi:MAG TPA: exodeoxyribonuclease III [Caldisericia bacterium]|nr:exodeoxyribonuclease III [Caldisericia bacterium]